MYDEALRNLTRHRHTWQEFTPDKRVSMPPLRYCATAECDAVQIHDGRHWKPSPYGKHNIAIQV
jgi:hypothetical protein